MSNILEDAIRRRRPEGLLDRAKDFMLDRLDDALEPMARQLSGKAGWDEMKENAMLASAAGGAADIVASHLVRLFERYPKLELHLVGHSAGSIFLAPMAQLLATKGKIATGPIAGRQGAGLKLGSLTLWAPACTVDLFKDCYQPLINNGAIARSALFCLDDQTEQDDHCARIYNKSLLYLVSNAFEAVARIPAVRDGVPILGMARAIKRDADLTRLIESGATELVLAPNDHPLGSEQESKAKHHGDFDDDPATVRATFARVLRSRSGLAGAGAALGPLVFESSESRLRTRRQDIDARTQLLH